MEFLNRVGEKFDWDNEELDVPSDKVEDDKPVAHPNIPAEIPGVPLESDYEPIHSEPNGKAVEDAPGPTLAQSSLN